MRRQTSRESGAVTVVVLVAMVAVVGFGAMVVDGGMLYHTQARLQSAADVAALAGARVLTADGVAAAVTRARSVAQANGLSAHQVQVTVDTANNAVAVRAHQEVAFGLARVLNHTRAEVAASATAAAQSVTGLRGAAPLGVVWREFVFGQVYDLKVGGGDGEGGWFGALDLGLQGGGAAEYRRHLEYGWDGLLSVGDSVEDKGGVMSGHTEKGMRDRLDRCNHLPACTFTAYAPHCPRLLIVPVVTRLDHNSFQVLGFAGFFVESLPGSGKDSIIRGRFVEFVAVGNAGPAAFYGARTFTLIR